MSSFYTYFDVDHFPQTIKILMGYEGVNISQQLSLIQISFIWNQEDFPAINY